MSLIQTRREGAVAIVTINRPERRNAIIFGMLAELEAHLRAAEADPGVRAMVITGAGADFCVGGDRELTARIAADPQVHRAVGEEHKRFAECLISLDTPTIAAVNGRAFGFGAELAALCDMAVLAADARLADPHVPLGLQPAPGVLMLWPVMAPRQVAVELLLTGREGAAEEALRLGLCNRLAPAGEAVAGALALAHEVSALPLAGVLHTMRALRRDTMVLARRSGAVGPWPAPDPQPPSPSDRSQ
ncbi:MAG TPA: enoyl-CoA hydratase/isomerase family protein [Novosphingobium sp.]|nr:enoyl-CoA hydratase/isomerase family protein [Novosphingobium sp.]